MGLFTWLFGKNKQNEMSEMLGQQEAMLKTDEHWRAFSPIPNSDLFPLKVGASNEAIYARIREKRFTLFSIDTMGPVPISDFQGGFLLFGTVWDVYTAVAIGTVKKNVDAGTKRSWGDQSDEKVPPRIAEAWYKESVYVLGQDSKGIASGIAGTPFCVYFDDDGAVRQIRDGVYCTRDLDQLG
jgi:hypothetical protein